MILAARRAEFDHHQKGRLLTADRFIPTPDAVIKVMLAAALALVAVAEPAPPTVRSTREAKPSPRIVLATKPKPRR